MPFKSKKQMRAAFATKGFGGKIDPKQWADETPNKKKLPDKVKAKSSGRGDKAIGAKAKARSRSEKLGKYMIGQ